MRILLLVLITLMGMARAQPDEEPEQEPQDEGGAGIRRITYTQDLKIQGRPEPNSDPLTFAQVLDMELVLNSYGGTAAACDIERFQVVEQIEADDYYVLELQYACGFANEAAQTAWEGSVNGDLSVLADGLGVLEAFPAVSSAWDEEYEQASVQLTESPVTVLPNNNNSNNNSTMGTNATPPATFEQVLSDHEVTSTFRQAFVLWKPANGTTASDEDYVMTTAELILLADGLALFATTRVASVSGAHCVVTRQTDGGGSNAAAAAAATVLRALEFQCTFVTTNFVNAGENGQQQDSHIPTQVAEKVNENLDYMTKASQDVGLTSIEQVLEMIVLEEDDVADAETGTVLEFNTLVPTASAPAPVSFPDNCQMVGDYQQRFTLRYSGSGGGSAAVRLETLEAENVLTVYESYASAGGEVDTRCVLKHQAVLRDEMMIDSYLILRFSCTYLSLDTTDVSEMPVVFVEYVNNNLRRTTLDLQNAQVNIEEAHPVQWLNAPVAPPPLATSGAAFKLEMDVSFGVSLLTAAERYNFAKLMERYGNKVFSVDPDSVVTECSIIDQILAVNADQISKLTVEYQCEFSFYSANISDPLYFPLRLVELINSNLVQVKDDLNNLLGIPVTVVFPLESDAVMMIQTSAPKTDGNVWVPPSGGAIEISLSAAALGHFSAAIPTIVLCVTTAVTLC